MPYSAAPTPRTNRGDPPPVGSTSDATADQTHDPALLEAVRLQADDHPLQGGEPATAEQHVVRMMHLRPYIEAASHAAGRTVLDVGCNTGYGTALLCGAAKQVIGVDVSEQAVAAARSRPEARDADFRVIDGLGLPFADAAFDLVTSFEVLEHVVEPEAFLRDLARVTVPGATLLISTPNAAIRLDDPSRPWNRFHIREFRAQELSSMLKQIFPEARVLGLFASPMAYQTELDRVTRARLGQRRMASENAGGGTPRVPRRRPFIVRLARRIVRAPMRRLRGERRRKPNIGSHDLQAVRHITPDDFFYSERDLDRSLNLLAICRNA